MLTSFFGKSKPVHFLILGAFIVFGFVWPLFAHAGWSNETISPLHNVLLIVVTVLGIILLDFIVSKNNLTNRNAFSIFFYTCFVVMVPAIFLHSEIIWANFFLLLALRRIISLQKDSNAERKILDGAVWISVASLFYFWSFLYFIPLLIAIVQKPNLTYKQVLIPIIGISAVVLINTALQILMNGTLTWFFGWRQPIDLDFSKYNSSETLVPATFVLTLIIFSLIYKWRNFGTISLKERSSYMLFTIICGISVGMVICAPAKDGSEMLFLFAPTAILCANYIEGSEEPKVGHGDRVEQWFKEMLLWAVLILAFMLLLL